MPNFADQFIQETKIPSNISNALGIISVNMTETIINDIMQMIEKQQRYSLDGYLFCLSRILAHKTAWQCVTEAFDKKIEPIPQKYKKLFGNQERIDFQVRVAE